MLSKKQKKKIIDTYATSKGDTGSPQVQVALLTHQLKELTEHLKEHAKDNHSRKGLIKIVGKRRRLLNYLKQSNPKAHQKIIKELSIRQTKLHLDKVQPSKKLEKLSTRTKNALQDSHITVQELSKLTDQQILGIGGIGKKGLQEIKENIQN